MNVAESYVMMQFLQNAGFERGPPVLEAGKAQSVDLHADGVHAEHHSKVCGGTRICLLSNGRKYSDCEETVIGRLV